jgi:hypothetical protein
MRTYFIITGGMCLFVAIVTVMDLLARRQDRRKRERIH